MKKTPVLKLCFSLAAGWGVAMTASGQMLDTLQEFGNAATGLPFSGMLTADEGEEFQIVPRGFTNTPGSDSGPYTITAAGTDFWAGSDNGSYLYNPSLTRDGDFSAVVRSVSAAAPTKGLTTEVLASQWGRAGIMARTNPSAANSANVAHVRKVGTTNPESTLQWRDAAGAATARVDPVLGSGEFDNDFELTINGDVTNTPVWLALHRVGGYWAASWADDDGGNPGTWSPANWHGATPATAGTMTIGLGHQSHDVTPQVNTAEFDNFSVTDFDDTLGDFSTAPFISSGSLSQDSDGNVFVTAKAEQVLFGNLSDVDWELQFEGAEGVAPGVATEIWVGSGNPGNLGAFETYADANPPSGTAYVSNVHWSNPGRSFDYPPEFAQVTGAFGAGGNGEEQFMTRSTFQLYVPGIGERAPGVEDFKEILIRDGVDDFAYLEVDGQVLIDDNNWTGDNGVRDDSSAGSPIVVLDVFDAKFDDGEWVDAMFLTGEGGGGDSGVLYWNAYDGIDNPDGFANPLDFPDPDDPLEPDPTLVSCFPEDLIPDENFRTLRPGVTSVASGFGQPTNFLAATMPADTKNVFLVVNGSRVATLPRDSDVDGIPDEYEIANGLNANDPADAAVDQEPDGLTNLEEYLAETLLTVADTDNDGLSDGDEVKVHGTDPLSADGDLDLLLDSGEIAAQTDPNNPDSDGDHVYDGLEVERGTDPLVPETGIGHGLVSYWPFDGDLNDAIDDNHGVEGGLGPIPFEAGKFGQGVLLDGIDQFVDIQGGAENEFDFTSGHMSVSAWFRADDLTKSWQALVVKGEGGTWRVHRRAEELPVLPDPDEFASGILTAAGGSGEGPINIDALDAVKTFFDTDPDPAPLYHTVLTVTNGGDHILYLNGVEVTRNGGSNLENRPSRLQIGGNPQGGNRTWAGLIDEVAVWGRDLSPEEVAMLWNNGEGATIPDLLDGGPVTPTEAFRISSVTYDGSNIAIEFPSEEGVLYVVEVSTTQQTGTWLENDDYVGAAGSTTVTLSAADVINTLGAPPTGEVYVRVLKR